MSAHTSDHSDVDQEGPEIPQQPATPEPLTPAPEVPTQPETPEPPLPGPEIAPPPPDRVPVPDLQP